MFAMALEKAGAPLTPVTLNDPQPGAGQVVIEIEACGVCRTDLHLLRGELPDIPYPIVPGHQVVGRVCSAGPGATIAPGERVGATWLGWTCGQCGFCERGDENLCERAQFNGYQLNGGYAQRMTAHADFCLPLPEDTPAEETAPLLCAGLIGFRSYRMAGPCKRLGIYGFGSAAHVVTQLAVQDGCEVVAFTRPGDESAQQFALDLGASWAGGSDQQSPVKLDAALIFAPVGSLVPRALKDVRRGGSVICGGIHMSDIPSFAYADLWGERRIQSVANLTRQDGRDFLAAIQAKPVEAQVTTYPLPEANAALHDLEQGRINGSAVLTVPPGGL